MGRAIQILTVCVCGLWLMTGEGLRAAEPLTEAIEMIEEGVVSTLTGSDVFEDTGYARISRRDWTPPTSTTLWRSPLVYSRMYPGKFYGQHGPSGPVRRYPIIAMPTDTSQQGFYYRHVPNWQFRGGMLPPVPRPSRWHRRPAPPSHHHTHAPGLETPAVPGRQAQRIPVTLR